MGDVPYGGEAENADGFDQDAIRLSCIDYWRAFGPTSDKLAAILA